MTVRAYLDHNASSPLRHEARSAMIEAMALSGNPSSVHSEGRAARKALEDAREAVAAAVGVRPAMVVFTSGGTEANAQAVRAKGIRRHIVSAVEHPSVMAAVEKTGLPVTVAPVDADGRLDLAALDALLSAGEGRALLSLMLANNETGVIQPVAEASAVAHRHGALVHVDAAQGLGRMPVRFALLGADIMTLSAHKCGGPKGVGAVVTGDAATLDPLLPGVQELRRRGGSENVPAVAGFGAAARLAADDDTARLAAMRDRLEDELRRLSPGIVFFGAGAARLCNTTSFAVEGLSAETALMALDLDGVAVSSGSACSSGKVARSAVLAAMGVPSPLAEGALRVSLGWSTTVEDIARFLGAFGTLVRRLGGRAAA